MLFHDCTQYAHISLCVDNSKLQNLQVKAEVCQELLGSDFEGSSMFLIGSKKIEVFQNCGHRSYRPASIHQRRCYTQNIDSLEHTAGPSEYPVLSGLAQFASKHPGTKGDANSLSLSMILPSIFLGFPIPIRVTPVMSFVKGRDSIWLAGRSPWQLRCSTCGGWQRRTGIQLWRGYCGASMQGKLGKSEISEFGERICTNEQVMVDVNFHCFSEVVEPQRLQRAEGTWGHIMCIPEELQDALHDPGDEGWQEWALLRMLMRTCLGDSNVCVAAIQMGEDAGRLLLFTDLGVINGQWDRQAQWFIWYFCLVVSFFLDLCLLKHSIHMPHKPHKNSTKEVPKKFVTMCRAIQLQDVATSLRLPGNHMPYWPHQQ